jgi:hypothetical protein
VVAVSLLVVKALPLGVAALGRRKGQQRRLTGWRRGSQGLLSELRRVSGLSLRDCLRPCGLTCIF